ncbi:MULTISPECIES: hypothetical protein [Bacillus cereus group]|uniref:hypothetical protein n=1 Tax=Bacillus cereus group TaxID=86661 RepID=UPI000279EF04|nr:MULTISPECIES: hypothetical protein [Bacillus cereus group]EJR25919.1 hypothetical protein IIE_06174 [Bacillus cereus VD045]
MKFLLVSCIKDVVILGRNTDGTPDHCFIKGIETIRLNQNVICLSSLEDRNLSWD